MYNLRNKVFTYLTVIKKSNKKRKAGIFWLCKCKCGKVFSVLSRHLVRKVSPTRSCGCFSKERMVKMKWKHGFARHPLYQTWSTMMKRCYNKNNKSYENYGGRGIFVSKKWHNVETFLKDMGEKPNNSYTLERINNSKGYSKTNCRWATMKEQAQNRRRPVSWIK